MHLFDNDVESEMMQIVAFDTIKEKIIELRSKKVILDSDVAELYGVETKRINEGVKNNPDKFPLGYIFEWDEDEKYGLVENFDQSNRLKYSTSNPKAFIEHRLYVA